jgi:hypothetical protein
MTLGVTWTLTNTGGVWSGTATYGFAGNSCPCSAGPIPVLLQVSSSGTNCCVTYAFHADPQFPISPAICLEGSGTLHTYNFCSPAYMVSVQCSPFQIVCTIPSSGPLCSNYLGALLNAGGDTITITP